MLNIKNIFAECVTKIILTIYLIYASVFYFTLRAISKSLWIENKFVICLGVKKADNKSETVRVLT